MREYSEQPHFAFLPSFEFHVHQERGAIATGCRATRPCLIIQQPRPISVISRLHALGRATLDPVTGGEKRRGKNNDSRPSLPAPGDIMTGFIVFFLLKKRKETRRRARPRHKPNDSSQSHNCSEVSASVETEKLPQISYTFQQIYKSCGTRFHQLLFDAFSAEL